MKFKITTILFLFVFSLNAQNNPNEELRAVWFTTVANLDWPNSWDRGDVEAQKASFIELVESLQEVNINTLFLQVRTECDAFYQSDYEPWSRFLTGTQGNDPGYDPLQFAIEEAHKRGMELHTWLNPYRINTSTNDGGSYYDDIHVYKQHPEWAIEYGSGKKILNPGLPQVQDYIKNIAGDIINKYDIDGFHFDDYFYAYEGTPTHLDSDTYENYGSEYSSIGDFRRGSINKMIKNVMDTILATKPYIRFGVSPFGIYGNGINPPGIYGLNAYSTIYCDPLAWLKEGSVDYINPQLYWPTGGSQDFGTLLPWWANWAEQYNRHVYAGHAIYRLDDNPALSYLDFGKSIHEYKKYFNLSKNELLRAGGWSLEEIVLQINIVRENRDKNALGSVYFRAKDFDRVHNLKQYVHDNAYQYKTLLPEQYWKNPNKPDIVNNIRFELVAGKSTFRLIWDNGDIKSRYAIYNTSNIDYPKSENLIDVSFNNYYTPTNDAVYDNLSIKIVKINRFWRKGDPSASFIVPKPTKPILTSPHNNYNSFSRNDMFIWQVCQNAGFYEIEFSKDFEFNSILNKFQTKDTVLNAKLLSLNGETDYFWRVRSANIAGYSAYSEIRRVTTGFPETPSYIYPNNNEVSVPLMPEIIFNVSSKTDSLQLQISRGGSKFEENRVFIDTVFKAIDKFIVENTLLSYTTHYTRIKATNELGNSNWSDIVKFKTLMPVPGITQITEPKTNTGLDENSDKVVFKWNVANNASYYTFQIAENSDFSTLIKDDYVYTGYKYTYQNPPKKKWMYARVAGRNIGGIAPWSDPIKFTLDNSVGIDYLEEKESFIYLFPNPSEDTFYLNVKLLEKSQPFFVNIYNYNGKKIYSKNVVEFPNNGIVSFNIKQYNCQPCLVQVTSTGFTQTLKLFKIK